MPVTRWDDRFLKTTKGRIVSLLRRGGRTVDELAAALELTDNAVRTHVAALERDGIVEQRGVRPTGGKPAYVYGVAADAERLFSKAYLPVLSQLVGVLEERMTPRELEALLTEVGKRVAAATGPRLGNVRARAEAAATVLTELGGTVDAEEMDGQLVLRGYSCPLADAVRAHPATCCVVKSLVAALIGRPIRERCERGARPRCRFEIVANALQDSRLARGAPRARRKEVE